MKMKKKLKNNEGFTLVELIVVIAIIGILVAIAVPRFGKSLDSAKLAADNATAKAVQTAVNMYYIDNDNTYPGVDSPASPATKAQFDSLKTMLEGSDYIDSIDQQTDTSKFEFRYDGLNGIVSLYTN